MKVLLFLLRRSKLALITAILAGFLSGACTAAVVAVVNVTLTGSGPKDRLLWAFLALLFGVPVTRLVSQYLLVRLGQQIVFDLRMNLSRRILASPLRRLEEVGNHRLLASLTGDIEILTNGLGLLPALSVNLAIVLGCLAYMAWLSPMLLALFAIFLLLGGVSYRLPMRRGAKIFKRSRETQDVLFREFTGLVEGNKELKLHEPRRAAFLDVLSRTAGILKKLNHSALMTFTAASAWGWFLFFVMVGLLLFAFPSLGQGIDRRALTGYTRLLLYMRPPLQQFLDQLPQLSRTSISIQKVESLGLALEGNAEPAAADFGRRDLPWRRLEMVGVSHSYRGEEGEKGFGVGPLDLAFTPGELVFVVGGNGSGKTTFAKLLTGLYFPEKGELRIDGEPVTRETLAEYRRGFTAVFSDFFLFEKLLGLEEACADGRAAEWISRLRLGEKLEIRNGAFSTTALSRGQRKRLALLTACLEDRPFCVFDEWASDQDPFFKRIFYREILPLLKERGKTVLVISHDDAYYDVADRLIKLDYGQVIQDEVLAPPVQMVTV